MKDSREPPIVIVKDDFEKLKGYVAATALSPVAEYLANELDRAQVINGPSRGTVRLGSHVQFRDSARGVTRTVTLVMPTAADFDAGRLSVLTPVGAALLGLSEGQNITYTLPNGLERTLHVVGVHNT